jgi:hypothetical protein
MQQSVNREKNANDGTRISPYIRFQARDQRDNHGKYWYVSEKEDSLT